MDELTRNDGKRVQVLPPRATACYWTPILGFVDVPSGGRRLLSYQVAGEWWRKYCNPLFRKLPWGICITVDTTPFDSFLYLPPLSVGKSAHRDGQHTLGKKTSRVGESTICTAKLYTRVMQIHFPIPNPSPMFDPARKGPFRGFLSSGEPFIRKLSRAGPNFSIRYTSQARKCIRAPVYA